MRLPLLAAAVAVLGMVAGAPGGAAAAARVPYLVDQAAIGAAPLGRTAEWYAEAFGTPRRDRLVGGLDRLVFEAHELAVLFRPGRDRAVAVVTWSSRYTTARQVGPCSRGSTLRSAYGRRLDTVVTGPAVAALRTGRLVFSITADGFVGAVLLAADGVSPLVALEGAACGVPRV
jgi:hypothetical protein